MSTAAIARGTAFGNATPDDNEITTPSQCSGAPTLDTVARWNNRCSGVALGEQEVVSWGLARLNRKVAVKSQAAIDGTILGVPKAQESFGAVPAVPPVVG